MFLDNMNNWYVSNRYGLGLRNGLGLGLGKRDGLGLGLEMKIVSVRCELKAEGLGLGKTRHMS